MARLSSILVVLFASAACSGKDPFNPGKPLGTFHVTGKLSQTTCGPAPDPWEFDVRLSHEGGTLYWVQGGTPISGIVGNDRRVVLEAQEQRELRAADARARTPACSVVREDELDVALAGEGEQRLDKLEDTTRFVGKLVYRFTPTDGSDCADEPTFTALPCQVAYDVTARK